MSRSLFVPLGPVRWSAQRKRITHLSSSYAAMKRQHRGCLPSQMSARAMAERLSLLLYGCGRHTSKCSTLEITGVAAQRGFADPVRCKLIANADDAHLNGVGPGRYR